MKILHDAAKFGIFLSNERVPLLYQKCFFLHNMYIFHYMTKTRRMSVIEFIQLHGRSPTEEASDQCVEHGIAIFLTV